MDWSDIGFEKWWIDEMHGETVHSENVPQILKNAIKKLAYDAWNAGIEWSDNQERLWEV